MIGDVATNEIKEGTLQEILYVDDLVLIALTMAEQREKFHAWKSALECKWPESESGEYKGYGEYD